MPECVTAGVPARPLARTLAGTLARTTSVVGRIATGLLLLGHAVLAWLLRVPGLTTEQDDAIYIALARALRAGSYIELPIVGTPAHAMYPPAYPALLAIAGVVAPDDIGWAVLVNIALSVAMLALAARLAARVSPWCGLALLMICAPSPLWLNQAAGVRSETLYAVATLVALSAYARLSDRSWSQTAAPSSAASLPEIHRAGRVGATSPTRGAMEAAAIAGVVVAALTRSIGLTLLIAMLAHLMSTRQWRACVRLIAVASLTVGVWMAWTITAPRLSPGRSYLADATVVYPDREGARLSATTPPATSDEQATGAPQQESTTTESSSIGRMGRIVVQRVEHHAAGYLRTYVPVALSLPMVSGTAVDNLLWAALLLIAGVAGLLRLWRPLRPVVLYLLVYAALLLVWPYLMTRYLAPTLPLLVLTLLAGVHAVVTRVLSPRLAVGAVAIFTLVLSGNAIRMDAARLARVANCDRAAPYTSSGCFDEEQRDFFAGIDAARQLTPDSARFVGAKDATFYLLSGRQSLRETEVTLVQDPQQFAALLRARGVGYILLSRVHLDQAAFAVPLRASCAQYEVLQRVGRHVVLLRAPAAADASASLVGSTSDRLTRTARSGEMSCAAINDWATGAWEVQTDGLW